MRQISLADSKCLKGSEVLNNSQLSVCTLWFLLGEADNNEKIFIHVFRPIRNMKVELFLRIVLNRFKWQTHRPILKRKYIFVLNMLLLSNTLLR